LNGSRSDSTSSIEPPEPVRAFCGSCHRFPPPDTLPRRHWAREIDRMYEIAQDLTEGADLSSLVNPDEVKSYYEKASPERLSSIDTTAGAGSGPLPLARREIRIRGRDPYPGITNVRAVALTGERPRELLVCDMRYGEVLLVDVIPAMGIRRLLRVGYVSHPARTFVVDLDEDGLRDILVANLGTVTPSDATNGSIEWLRQSGELVFEKRTIAEGLGRVSDVRAADFDGDGDLDLIAAVFGWRRVGEILYFENVAEKGVEPRFEQKTIDGRPGAIHVPIIDLDRDGRPDFIAVIAQQYETVVAFYNKGSGEFEPRTLYEAPHPHWGCSGIELFDFDGDGDEDILFPNGDTLDDLLVKPWHGAAWLENPGTGRESGPWRYHRLTDLYGAHWIEAGDVDGDGDSDLVISAFLPMFFGLLVEGRGVDADLFKHLLVTDGNLLALDCTGDPFARC